MAATNYALLVARLRVLGNDTETSNPKFGDTPVGIRNSANVTFRIAYPNPVKASMYLTYGASVIRQPAGVSTFTILDGPSGYITMAAAPDAGTTTPFFFDYFYQWFLDADYNSMLDIGTEMLGGVAGTDLVEGLYPAQLQYALSEYWNRRASQFANLFPTVAAGAGSQPQMPAQNFSKLAESARKAGDMLRDDYYKRFGKRNAPASGTITYGFSQYTPRR